MKKLKLALVALTGLSLLTGCMNMPTPAAQISGTYVSSLQFEKFDMNHLTAELDSLKRRESQLVIAQQQRYKTSQMQAFWMGFGQGDGIEASELAVVRGQIEAVTKALAIKSGAKTELPKKE